MADDKGESLEAEGKVKKGKRGKKAMAVEEPPAEKPHEEHHSAPQQGQMPGQMPVQKLVLKTVEDLHAPEFFATDAQSISLINGMISIAFASSRYDYSEVPSVLKNVVVSRIVMSPAGAQNLAVRLFSFLESKGFAAVPKDPKQRQ